MDGVQLHDELVDLGFHDVRVLGVEGPAWMVADVDARWSNAAPRSDMMAMGRALEAEATILGVSAQLVAVGRR